jgi:hypothetical protein
MPKPVDCNQCGRTIGPTDPNFGTFKNGVLTNLCSVLCRTAFREGEPPAAIAPKARRPSVKQPGQIAERQVSAAVEQRLTLAGIWNTRLQSGRIRIPGKGQKVYTMQLCQPGTPDRMAAAGLMTFIEVKKPGETMSPEQVQVAEELRQSGALVFTIDDPDKIDRLLKAIDAAGSTIDVIRQQIYTLNGWLQSQVDGDAEIAGE